MRLVLCGPDVLFYKEEGNDRRVISRAEIAQGIESLVGAGLRLEHLGPARGIEVVAWRTEWTGRGHPHP